MKCLAVLEAGNGVRGAQTELYIARGAAERKAVLKGGM